MEHIVPGSTVVVGKKEKVRAVVCTIRPRRVEVVYLDAANKALHQEIQWRTGDWVFLADVQDGRPADKDPRLEQYVKIVRTLEA